MKSDRLCRNARHFPFKVKSYALQQQWTILFIIAIINNDFESVRRKVIVGLRRESASGIHSIGGVGVTAL
jgi:hypothetical protein